MQKLKGQVLTRPTADKISNKIRVLYDFQLSLKNKIKFRIKTRKLRPQQMHHI